MTVKDIITFIETIAPPSLQEDYDNAGLVIGNGEIPCTGALICLDVTADILREAADKACNLVIAHHPPIFRGLKKINGKNDTERNLITAIKNNIAVYAVHTNLDNILSGVNGKMAEKIGLQNLRVLQPKTMQLRKLVCFAPPEMADAVKEAIFAAGAGNIGKYSECSFSSNGNSSFKPGEGADPVIGKIGIREVLSEMRMEFIYAAHKETAIITAMKKAHGYEEVAYDVISLSNMQAEIGSGIVGELPFAETEQNLLEKIAGQFSVPVIRHTVFTGKMIRTVALCGGAGAFLRDAAKQAGAQAFISSDFKYHDFFDAEADLLYADIGHYESEQFTVDLIHAHLKDKFPNFALLKTGLNTNPVRYFVPPKN